MSETLKGPSMKFSGTVRQKKFDKKWWHNPLKQKVFRYAKPFNHQRDPWWNNSAGWHREISTETSDITLLSTNFLDTRNKWHRKAVPLRNFSAMWDKIFCLENCDTLCFSLVHKTFWYQKVFDKQKGHPRTFFSNTRQKKFDGIYWYSPLPPSCP